MLSRALPSAMLLLLVALLPCSAPAAAQSPRRPPFVVRTDGFGFGRLTPARELRPDSSDPPRVLETVSSRDLRIQLVAEERRRIGRSVRISLTPGIDLRAGAWWSLVGPRSFVGLGLGL